MISGIFSIGRPLPQDAARRLPGAARCGDRLLLAAGGGRDAFFQDDRSGSAAALCGELYNAEELRRVLLPAGARFTGTSEAELLLRAWEAWGPACQERLNGDWAFAAWDAAKGTLFCSRDRFGVRPLYYVAAGGLLRFSSSLRGLLPLLPELPAPDAGVVFDYLSRGGTGRPGETFLSGVRALRAGHCLSAGPRGAPAERRYYDPPVNEELGRYDERSAARHAERLRELLLDAVRLRLRPPCPAGGALSGGLDSSTIACLVRRLSDEGRAPAGFSPRDFRLFSVLWPAEAAHIKASAGAAGFRHRRVSPRDCVPSWKDVAGLAAAAERPLHDTTFFGEFGVAKAAAADGAGVLFEGGGGDELLAGYPERYTNPYLNQLLAGRDLAGFRREFARLYAGRLELFGLRGAPGPDFYKIFLRTQSSAPHLSPLYPEATLDPGFYGRYRDRAGAARARLRLNLQFLLRDDALALGDSYDATSALRYRRPFLDHRVATLAFSLPACYKFQGGWTKYLLRRAMDGVLPRAVCWRREKVGGTAPISEWKKFLARHAGELRATLAARGLRSAEFVDRRGLLKSFDRLLAAALAPETTDNSALWRLVNLELWLGGLRAAAKKSPGPLSAPGARCKKAGTYLVCFFSWLLASPLAEFSCAAFFA